MQKSLHAVVSGAFLLCAATDYGQGTDSHTERFLTVAQLLANGSTDRTIVDNVKIDNRENGDQATIADFFAYADECELEEIYSIPQAPSLPIMVEWDCQNILKPGSRVEDMKRQAGFSFREGVISRITFGKAGAVELSFDQLN